MADRRDGEPVGDDGGLSPGEAGAAARANVISDEVRGVAVAGLEGEVDLSNVEIVERRLAETLFGERAGSVLDLSEIRFLDSSALRMLLNLGAMADEEGRKLHLVVAEGSFAAHVLEVTRFQDMLAIHPTVERAIDSLD
jgi:anti-anti-sigma factor